jgi:hypothetical protein
LLISRKERVDQKEIIDFDFYRVGRFFVCSILSEVRILSNKNLHSSRESELECKFPGVSYDHIAAEQLLDRAGFRPGGLKKSALAAVVPQVASPKHREIASANG